MEQFNNELLELTKSLPEIKVKDYSNIYNIIVHMLEDPNMLVFIEAIKTVEYMSIILKSGIKSSKMK